MSSPAIRIQDLSFGYGEGDFELRIGKLEVGRASSAAFIGPSGSGKTTLLHLIAGITLPQSGKIETNGVELTGLSENARRAFRIKNIGLVFQEFELLEYLTVLDNVLLPYRINAALELTEAVRERAANVAVEVGIGDKLSRYPSQLSQGERQRVAVCRAVVTEPAVLMADEPTGNLDPRNKGRVLDILFDYVETSGTTLLTVTHDHDLLDRFERIVDFKELLS
ncbi:MAG: ABC transporter ATP-binding protein [Acidobacteria bacterium]|nr:MAG: ABC transporter ATP-binding protein [Acidobacteriota bacterium]